jgi:hypothetical protein
MRHKVNRKLGRGERQKEKPPNFDLGATRFSRGGNPKTQITNSKKIPIANEEIPKQRRQMVLAFLLCRLRFSWNL